VVFVDPQEEAILDENLDQLALLVNEDLVDLQVVNLLEHSGLHQSSILKMLDQVGEVRHRDDHGGGEGMLLEESQSQVVSIGHNHSQLLLLAVVFHPIHQLTAQPLLNIILIDRLTSL
jgi:hypothetical protein